MTIFRRHLRRKTALLVVLLILIVGAAAFAAYKFLPGLLRGNGAARPSSKDIGLYLENGDLWQWIGGRKTRLTKLGTITAFDWHPAGGELVYLTHETDGTCKVVHHNLTSKQELVIYQDKAQLGPKILCTAKDVLLVDASPLPVSNLLKLTVTALGYDGTAEGSFWTQVPITQDQFNRTTFLTMADGTTPLLLSPGGIWAINTASSALTFDTAHTFLGSTGVSFSDGTFFGPLQDTKGTFLGLRSKDGSVTDVAPLTTGSSILPPFVRDASRSTDGKTVVYELASYSSGTTTGGANKTLALTYETWQYTVGARKPRLVTRGSSPSLFTFQFTGEAAPVKSGKQPGATVATTTGLMFRDRPNTTGSNVLEVAAPSETRPALALGEGWIEARGLGQAKGKTGWIYGGYVAVTRGSSSYAPFACISASKTTKVYLDQSLGGTVATTLDPGDSVVATGISADKRVISVMLPSGTEGFVQAASVAIAH